MTNINNIIKIKEIIEDKDKNSKAKIQIVGVGSIGSKIISILHKHNLNNAETIIMDSDITSIRYDYADKKIFIGQNTLKKLGFGLNNDRDKELTEKGIQESITEIDACFKNIETVIIISEKTTASGLFAAPLIEKIAKKNGAEVIMLSN